MNPAPNFSHLTEGVIMRQRGGHTIFIKNIGDAFRAKAHVDERLTIIAVDALNQGAKFVKIEPVESVLPSLMDGVEIWHGVMEGTRSYTTERIG